MPRPERGEKISGGIAHPATTGTQKLRVYRDGGVNVDRTLLSMTKRVGGRTVTSTRDPESIVFANTEGEVIPQYLWLPESTAYGGISKTRIRFRT